MSTLDWITIEGFKSIARIERLELRPINVLVGSNGSGKSNFIDAFSFLNAIRNGNLRNYVARAGDADRMLHFSSKTTRNIAIHVSFMDEYSQYRIELEANESDEMYPSKEILYFWTAKRLEKTGKKLEPSEIQLSPHNGEAGVSKSSTARHIHAHLDHWMPYHFQDASAASPMKKTTDVNDNRRLRVDGSNLAAFLYLLCEKYEEAYDMIRRTVRLAAPFFEDFLLEPLALNEDKIRLEWKHRGSDGYFDSSSLSDGTLRFIALAALLLQPSLPRPPMILLDEPEIGLHPCALTLLASLVRKASRESQIVLATQSPILLDHFEPEDVLVADRTHGATVFTRLDRPELEEWLQNYSLGELWEKNEFGGRPAPEDTGRTPPK